MSSKIWIPTTIGLGFFLLTYWLGWLLLLVKGALWLLIGVAATICIISLYCLSEYPLAAKSVNFLNAFDRQTWEEVAGFSVFLILVAILLVNLLPSTDEQLPNSKSERVLVIIIPGTYGNDGFWANCVNGKATFASELKKSLPANSEVYPFLWASSVFHTAREMAAKDLAHLIDKRCGEFDRICLVGHSHGGNIALRAAGLCDTRIDQVICLSTPHAHLSTRAADGSAYSLPVYATRETISRVNSIVSIVPDRDNVPEGWSNELLTGLEENDAIRLTTGWREELGHPRLNTDAFLDRLFGNGNVFTSNRLGISSVQHIVIRSLVVDSLGIRAHRCVHSIRMGMMIGAIIAKSSGPSKSDLDYMSSLIQPPEEDFGEPVPQSFWQSTLLSNQGKYTHSGWVLDEIQITLTREAEEMADDLDGSMPDPFLKFASIDEKTTYLTTPSIIDKLSATWNPQFVLYKGESVGIWVRDNDLFSSDALGGGRAISSNPEPPKSITAIRGVPWSAKLKWVAVHY